MGCIRRDGKKKIPVLKWKYRGFLYITLLFTAALSLLNTRNNVFPFSIGILIYVIAACSLTFTCFYIVSDIKLFKCKVQEIAMPVIVKNHFTERLATNYRYRTVTFATTGLLMNLAFAVFNSVVGIKSQSAWYITLSVYYTLLSIMRYWAVNYERRISKAEQEVDSSGACSLQKLQYSVSCYDSRTWRNGDPYPAFPRGEALSGIYHLCFCTLCVYQSSACDRRQDKGW